MSDQGLLSSGGIGGVSDRVRWNGGGRFWD